MKVVIFCGGVGTRFWPLSRKALPKQFDTTIFNHKSTFQMAVERVLPAVSAKDILVATNKEYKSFVKEQFPQIPPQNIILEPQVRDLAPAVGLVTHILFKENPDEPFTIIWSDHLVEKPDMFRNMVKKAEEEIKEKRACIIFYGHTPRFANENLGWITYRDILFKEKGITAHKFVSWKYRPNLEDAKDFFESGRAAWNLGYWTTTPRFLVEKYKILAEDMHKSLTKIARDYKTSTYSKTLEKIYPTLEKISFDDKIIHFIKPYEAAVLVSDIGWSDPGTLYALKESLQKSQKENILIGNCQDLGSEDSLVFNRQKDVLVASIGLSGYVVAVTKDVVLVCPKEKVPDIKALIKNLEQKSLSKYL